MRRPLPWVALADALLAALLPARSAGAVVVLAEREDPEERIHTVLRRVPGGVEIR